MGDLKAPILMAIVGGAQGIRGEVRVRAYTADPLALADYGSLSDGAGREFEILEVRAAKAMLIVRFRGINDRNAAEALNGTELFVERDLLPDDDLEDDEFFQADLEGLDVFDDGGAFYGSITGVLDFGGGDILELKKPGERSVLIPFSDSAVLDIDIEAGRIVIDPVAAGLAEAGAAGEGDEA